MYVQSSALFPQRNSLRNRPIVASITLPRRDVTVEDWSDPMVGKYGLKATTRFGLGILRSNAIAKITNIKKCF